MFRCCLKFVLGIGFSALALWFIYRPIDPRYYLIDLSLAGNLTSSSFHLEIENKNKHMGICHDPITLSLFPRNAGGANLTVLPTGSAVVPGFYQGYQKTAEKYGNFTGGGAMGNGSAGVFGVRVESGYRFKVMFWKTRHRKVRVAGDVEVGEDGKKTAEKGIRLSSAAAARGSTAAAAAAAAVVLLLHYLLSLWLIYH